MNEPNQETIKLTTDMDQFSVVPGGSLEMTLVLTNKTEMKHDYNRPGY